MNTRNILQARPLAGALFTLLLATALWSLPGRAHAQIYVGQDAGGGNVSEFDAGNGTALNPSFINSDQEFTEGLLLSGNTLFVTDYSNNSIGAYNATTGVAINTSFVTGLSGPEGLALSGNHLFVANLHGGEFEEGSVGEYDATTGAVINATFIGGLYVDFPFGLAVSGNNLFVSNNSGYIGKFDATTGAPINDNFITDDNYASLAISGNHLFASGGPGAEGGETVAEYDATTGDVINADFITAPDGSQGISGIAISGNLLFDVAAGPNLFEGVGGMIVGEYDATTGAAINPTLVADVANPGDGEPDPASLAVAAAPEPGSATLLVTGLLAMAARRRRHNTRS